MTIYLECIESNGDWTEGHVYKADPTGGGFYELSDDSDDDFAWSADSREEYNRETEEYDTVWFLPGIEGVAFKEVTP
ncbi:hypothetical protein [Erwinia sp. S38]|uniref:hypothetical protein n=1 Tax=Erwinia sp. S38 TaxID=2769338 RepID=UPI00190D8E5F|nr:hypothetical protein [Erwinia sp. S38]MBK0003394.1 hypothetical protein [Erwinia sp. S38]